MPKNNQQQPPNNKQKQPGQPQPPVQQPVAQATNRLRPLPSFDSFKPSAPLQGGTRIVDCTGQATGGAIQFVGGVQAPPSDADTQDTDQQDGDEQQGGKQQPKGKGQPQKPGVKQPNKKGNQR